MDALVIVVIVVAVLMGLIGLGVVAGSGRTRRMDERRFHAEEVRREEEFHDARAEQAREEAEESMERGRRFERRAEGEEVPPDADPGGLGRAPSRAARRRLSPRARVQRVKRTRLAAILAATVAGVALPGAAQAAGRCGDHPWCDRSMPADARAGLLLTQLSLDEKLDLMGGDVDGILHPETSSSTVNGIPRLDVPPLTVNDGPGGIRQGIGPCRPATALPAPLALGASFDLKLAARYARVIAAEAKRRGHDLVLGPDGQPRARPARRAHLRELRRGPAGAERLRGRLDPRAPGRRGDRGREALRREQPGDGALHRQRDHRRAHAARDLPAALRGGGQARPTSARS